MLLVHQIQERAGDRSVAGGHRGNRLAGGGVPERGGGHVVEAVRQCGSDHGGMIPIVDRKGLSERVVEGQLVLCEESDRLVVDVLVRVVRFVLSHESVIGAREICVLWIGPVGFPMALGPTMVETRGAADSPVVEGEYLLASQVQVVVRAPEIAA